MCLLFNLNFNFIEKYIKFIITIIFYELIKIYFFTPK